MTRKTVSFSELSTLADCEKKWEYRYTGPRVDTPPSPAMLKGTLIHAGVNGLWTAGDWQASFEEAWGEAMQTWEPCQDYEDAADDATWVLGRYLEHYHDLSMNMRVEAVEKELTAKLPGTSLTVRCFIDRIVIIDGVRWLVETKTMKDWSRLDLITVDPQQTLYWWVAEQNGLKPYGILFDAIRTYRWKLEKPTQKALIEEAVANGWRHQGIEIAGLTTAGQREWARAAVELHPGVERPTAESFQQLWIDRTPEQVEQALQWARVAASRRALIESAGGLRNIGPFCKGCAYKDQCFDEFAFPESVIEPLP